MFNKIKNYLFYKGYRFNLHLDLATLKRWKWRKFFVKNKKVLEIGSGGGLWTIELLLKGNEVASVDIDVSTLERLKRKTETFPLKNKALKLIHCHVKNFKTSEKYDQIILFEVLEHIKDDRQALQNIVKSLKPKGRLLISTPSDDFIQFYGSCDKDISEIENGGHVRKGYSFEELGELLKEAGFKIVYRDSCGGFFTQKCLALGWYLADVISPKLIFRILINLILRPVSWLDFSYPSYPKYINFVIAERY